MGGGPRAEVRGAARGRGCAVVCRCRRIRSSASVTGWRWRGWAVVGRWGVIPCSVCATTCLTVASPSSVSCRFRSRAGWASTVCLVGCWRLGRCMRCWRGRCVSRPAGLVVVWCSTGSRCMRRWCWRSRMRRMSRMSRIRGVGCGRCRCWWARWRGTGRDGWRCTAAGWVRRHGCGMPRGVWVRALPKARAVRLWMSRG